MKLLTLNLHNLPLTWRKENMDAFAAAIAMERPDVIALQEVFAAEKGSGDPQAGENPLEPILDYLALQGAHYYGVWKPLKIGYGTYREGLAILSVSPIEEVHFTVVSDTCDPNDWKKRGILGVSLNNRPDTLFFSVHYGWWGDADEPFARQWAKTVAYLAPYEGRRILLMGDFNNPASRRGEGYDRIVSDGWQDAYSAARNRVGEATVLGAIDGWKGDPSGKRIDYIFSNRSETVRSAVVLLDGKRYPIVSDHFGLCVDYEEGV